MTFIFFNKYPRKRQGPVEIGRLSSPPTLSPRYVGSQKPSEARGREGEGVDEGGGAEGGVPFPTEHLFLNHKFSGFIPSPSGSARDSGGYFGLWRRISGRRCRRGEKAGEQTAARQDGGPAAQVARRQTSGEITWPPFSPSSGTPSLAAAPSHATEIMPKRLANAVT